MVLFLLLSSAIQYGKVFDNGQVEKDATGLHKKKILSFVTQAQLKRQLCDAHSAAQSSINNKKPVELRDQFHLPPCCFF